MNSFTSRLIASSVIFTAGNFIYQKFFNKKKITVHQYIFGYVLVQYGHKDTLTILFTCFIDTLIYIPCAIGLKHIFDKLK